MIRCTETARRVSYESGFHPGDGARGSRSSVRTSSQMMKRIAISDYCPPSVMIISRAWRASFQNMLYIANHAVQPCVLVRRYPAGSIDV